MSKNNSNFKQVIVNFAIEYYINKTKTDIKYKTFKQSCTTDDIPVLVECMKSSLDNGEYRIKKIHKLGVYEDLGDKLRVLNEF